MIYKSRLEVKESIVLGILVLFCSWLAYVLTDYFIIGLLVALIGILFTIINLKQVLFYSEYIEFVNPIIKRYKRIQYNSVEKVVLFGHEDIKFATNPSLIIHYTQASKKKVSFSVKNNDSLFSILSFLKRDKRIKIEKKSNYKNHRDLSI